MQPLPLRYEGEGQFTSPRGFAKRADCEFVIGQIYHMTAIEERSAKQHARYFALVNEYWQTLPEEMAGVYPSSEHLRKAALCHTGYCNEVKIACASNDAAVKCLTAFKRADSYAIVSLENNVVRIWTAETQNTKAMDKQRFKASSDAVLTWIETHCLGMHQQEIAA